jgi:hypothetical protein
MYMRTHAKPIIVLASGAILLAGVLSQTARVQHGIDTSASLTPAIPQTEMPAVAQIYTPSPVQVETLGFAQAETSGSVRIDSPAVAQVETTDFTRVGDPVAAQIETTDFARVGSSAGAQIETTGFARVGSPAAAQVETVDFAQVGGPSIAEVESQVGAGNESAATAAPVTLDNAPVAQASLDPRQTATPQFQPLPEPSTVGLLLAGSAAMLRSLWRKRSS